MTPLDKARKAREIADVEFAKSQGWHSGEPSLAALAEALGFIAAAVEQIASHAWIGTVDMEARQ